MTFDEVIKRESETVVNILQETIKNVEKIRDYHELPDIITNMVEELRERSVFSLVNGEKYYVIQLVKNLIRYNEEFKDYELDDDRMEWIIREFHDNQFDFDEFENGVKEAMIFTAENYEKPNC